MIKVIRKALNIKNVSLYSGFLRQRIIFIIIMCITSQFIDPVMLKFKGENLSVNALCVLSGLSMCSGIVYPMVVDFISMRVIKYGFIMSDLVTCAALSWLIMGGVDYIMIVMMILGCTSCVESILGFKYMSRLEAFIMREVGTTDEYTRFKTSVTFYSTAAQIVGLLVAGGISLFAPIEVVATVGIALTLGAIPTYVCSINTLIEDDQLAAEEKKVTA